MFFEAHEAHVGGHVHEDLQDVCLEQLDAIQKRPSSFVLWDGDFELCPRELHSADVT